MSQAYPLGYAAVDALLGPTMNVSHVLSFFRLLNSVSDWRTAFAGSFGRPAEDFYDEVARLRR